MKKRIFSLLVFLFVLIPCVGILSGCGKKDEPKVIATYNVASVTMTVEGFSGTVTKAEYDVLKTTPEEDLDMEDAMKLMMVSGFFEQTLTLKDNNTFVCTMEGESVSGSWTKNETSYVLTAEGESATYVIGENTLTETMSMDGDEIVIVYELV